jgi:glycerophosphoryl diester phosphodiesterase
MSVWREKGPLVVGHRGGRGEGWPAENTLAAFDRARVEGAAAIELDVRTSAGGEVVVFHDAALTRATSGSDRRRVADVPIGELRGLGAPSLGDVLAWAQRHGVAVNVELKHDVPRRASLARATAAEVRASGVDVLLSSFDPVLLAMVSALAPSAPRALLTHTGQARWADALREAARPRVVGGLHLERTQTGPEAIARYLRRGLRVGVWTVNDPAEARDLARLGAATIITDAPGAILAALK